MKAIIGIDPGKSGGIAFYVRKAGWIVAPLPFTKDKIDRKVIRSMIHTLNISECAAYIEKAQVFPGQGGVSNFTMGKNYGYLIAILEEINEIKKIEEVSSRVWKKYFSLDKDKKKSVDLAIKSAPYLKDSFVTQRGRLIDGNAEALLIGLYGVHKESENGFF